MNEALKLADSAAAKSSADPNYLPIVLLFIAVIGGVWLFRWLVGRLERQTELLTGLFKEANEGRVRVAEIVAINTETLRENTEFLRRAK